MGAEPAFERLAPFLREFIYQAGWEGLRPIQVEAIQAIFDSNDDILIAAGTASGKTEAAFLPILSLVQPTPHGSVQALYVGPLRALINDQFERLEGLCERGDIPVHRWHGDVEASHKAELIEKPGGILQITPESIESLLINKQAQLRRVFGGLRFIVIDEVHAFLESDRGVQLRSQLERLSQYPALGRPRRVGLSATVGDFAMAKRWLNPHAPEQVHLINPSGVQIATRFSHVHFPNAADVAPPELIDDLFPLTRDRKSLIFCNSRAEVELLTSLLNRRCSRERFDERYFPHHGSISKEVREGAEARMKDKTRPASVVCTNTLELGIDIGQLDLVVQINSTHSVMSFVQRLGRSGRRGQPRMMQVYTLEPEAEESAPFYERLPFRLLKSLAVTDLFLEQWVEPPIEQTKPYHIAYHQLLSRLTENHGCSPRDLIGFFFNTQVFPHITSDDYATLLTHLAQTDQIEQMADGDLILGLAGERIVRSRDFYAVFQTPPEWNVLHGERNIGRIAPSPDLLPGVCLLLAGKVWEVKDVLPEQKLVLVIAAKEARNVLFMGTGIPEMHPRIAQKVRDILCRADRPGYLSESGQAALAEARRLSQEVGLLNADCFETDTQWILFPWSGTRAVRTLLYLFKHIGYQAGSPNGLFPWVVTLAKGDGTETIQQITRKMLNSLPDQAMVLASIPLPQLLSHKFDELLPEKLVRLRAVHEWVDWGEAATLLQSLSRDRPRTNASATRVV